ncbi:MAG: hypothetical protein QOE86_547, partial [Solirubrobacteraceae bacterium]|nr:hypothetical protein [Solirubrobacteraceae bacterium]
GDDLNALERAFLDASRAESEREARRAGRTNRRLRALLASVAVLLVLAAGAGILFLGQRGAARGEARAAEAQRLGAQALVEDDLDRSLLLARQGVELEDDLQTRGNLLAALLRSPAAIGVARVSETHLSQLALRPDGRVLAVGDDHGDVDFLDPLTHRPVHAPYRPQPSYIRQLVFSPDGSRLVVGGVDMMQLLDGRTFRRLATLAVPRGGIQFINVAFSPDGRALTVMRESASGGSNPRLTAIMLRFDGRTGRHLGPPVSVPETGSMADFSAFLPDGRRLVTVARGTAIFPAPNARPVFHGSAIVVRDARTLRPLRTFPAVAVAGALSPDGHIFAAGGDDGSVRFLDLRSGRLRIGSGRHAAAVRGASFAPDGRTLVTVGQDAKAIVWDVRSAAATETYAGHAGPIIGHAIDRESRTLYTASGDGTVITWDLQGNRRLGAPFDVARTSGDWFVAAAISRDGRSIAMQQADGTDSVVDLTTLRRRVVRIQGRSGVRSTPFAPAIRSDGTLVASGADGFLALVDARTGLVVSRLRGHRDIVFTPTVSADGSTIASTGEDGTLRLWDARTGRPTVPAIRLGTVPTGDAGISTDGTQVAVPLPDAVEVFDAGTRHRVAQLHIDESATTFARFSRDGRLLLTGSGDGRVRVFSARDRRALGPAFRASNGSISSVDAGPGGRVLVTAGTDGQTRLWDRASRRPIGAALPGPENLNAVAFFALDGTHVFAAFSNGRGYRWDVRPRSWERQACRVAGRRLSRAEWYDALPGRSYAPAC